MPRLSKEQLDKHRSGGMLMDSILLLPRDLLDTIDALESEKAELLAALKKLTQEIGIIFVGLQLDKLDRNFALEEIKRLVREAEIARAAIQHAEATNG